MKNSFEELENIMKKYQKDLKKIDDKYNLENINKRIAELQEKIENKNKFVEKIEAEATFNPENEELVNKAKEKIKEFNEEKSNLEEARDNADKYKKQLVTLPSGREVTMEEKDQMVKSDLKTKVIRDLNKKSQDISEEIVEKTAELEEKRKAWNDFKYEYTTDADGNRVTTNEDEVKKLHEDYDKVKVELSELNGMQVKCNEYLEKLHQRTQADKDLEKAINEKYEKTKKEEKQELDLDGLSEEARQAISKMQKEKKAKGSIADIADIKATTIDNSRDHATMLYTYTNEKDAKSKGAYQYSLRRYKKVFKDIKEGGIYDNESGEVVELNKKALKNIDPFLIKYLSDRDNAIAVKMIKALNEGKDLSEFKNVVSYDMKGADQFGRKAKKIYRKIALNAAKNGLVVENADCVKTWFDKLTRRGEMKFEPKEAPKALEAPKVKTNETSKEEYTFDEISDNIDFKNSLYVDIKDVGTNKPKEQKEETDLHEIDNDERE